MFDSTAKNVNRQLMDTTLNSTYTASITRLSDLYEGVTSLNEYENRWFV